MNSSTQMRAYEHCSIRAITPDMGVYPLPGFTPSRLSDGRYPIDAKRAFIQITKDINSIDVRDQHARNILANFEFLPSVQEIHVTHSDDDPPSSEIYTFIVGTILDRIKSIPGQHNEVELFASDKYKEIIDESFAGARVMYE